MIVWPWKKANEAKDYGADWKGELEPLELITSSLWSVVQGDVQVGGANVSGTVAQVRVAGGSPGTSAEVRNDIVTSRAQTFSEVFRLKVKSTNE